MKDKNKKLGQEPAFPCEVGFLDGEIRQQHQNGNYTALDNGMSNAFTLRVRRCKGYYPVNTKIYNVIGKATLLSQSIKH